MFGAAERLTTCLGCVINLIGGHKLPKTSESRTYLVCIYTRRGRGSNQAFDRIHIWLHDDVHAHIVSHIFIRKECHVRHMVGAAANSRRKSLTLPTTSLTMVDFFPVSKTMLGAGRFPVKAAWLLSGSPSQALST